MRILRGTGSRLLPCGCLLGLYDTYDGRCVAIVDNRHPRCSDTTHRVDAVIDPTPLQRPVTHADLREPKSR